MTRKFPTAVVLAAGESTRFYPLSTSTNKSFIELAGKPLLAHTLLNLQQAGCARAVVVVSAREYAETQLGELAEKFQLNLTLDFVLQAESSGEVSALKQAIAQIDEIDDDHMLIFPGYQVTAGTLGLELLKELSSVDTEQSIAITPQSATSPDSRRVAGWLLMKDTLTKVANESADSINQGLHTVLGKPISTISSDHAIAQYTYSWDLLDVFPRILDQYSSHIAQNARVAPSAIIDDSNGPVIIDHYAQINDFVKITGPSYIGSGVVVREHSSIQASSIEHNVLVGSYTEIKRSVILGGCTIHQSYCADSVLGEDTRVGAGLLTSNLRFDNQSVKVILADTKIDTRRRKLGIITGPGVKLGVRTTTMPGTIIGEATTIFPSLMIAHSHPARTIVQTSTIITER